MQQNFVGGQKAWHKCKKVCAFYQKYGAFWGKINCAPFSALFGLIWCALEPRIIRHSVFDRFSSQNEHQCNFVWQKNFW